MERKTGTTVVALKGRDFIVMAADRQATFGEWAFSETKKIVRIYKDIWLGTAGSSADTQQLAKYLEVEARLYELEKGYPPTTKILANILSQYLYSGRWSFFPFFVHLIVAGKDSEGYSIFSLDLFGGMEEEKYTAVGSGSLFAISVLDAGYKEDISKEDAIKLALNALRVALKRDIYTGWYVDLLVIDEKGSKFYEKVLAQEIVEKGKI